MQMEFIEISEDTKWWVLTVPAIVEFSSLHGSRLVLFCLFIGFLTFGLLGWAFSTGGPAWKKGRNNMGRVSIPGPTGLPIFGSLFSLSHGLAHHTLARMASSHAEASQLMAFSLGSTPAVVTSQPQIAREILTSPHFANRPIKESAKQLMFSRAIRFAPSGTYWLMLRRIAAGHLFSPSNILAHEPCRQLECATMVNAIAKEQSIQGFVLLRTHLQAASLNNIMDTVFGKRYDRTQKSNHEAKELHELVREGFELLGAFNWSDHLPWLKYFFNPFHIQERCAVLVPKVKTLIEQIIKENQTTNSFKISNNFSFLHVLLSLDGEEKLEEADMIAVLWEMVFRGTDTTTLLTEWIMAELVLNPHIQKKLRAELDTVLGNRGVTDADIPKLPYLNAVVKETLRLHPPGPLLSWTRLSTSNVQLSNGMIIPANTTAMVNMWAITHDPNLWNDPLIFKPERFMPSVGGVNIDVRGNDFRLAPFGAGLRVCPGKSLGLATGSLWVAKLVHHFEWVENGTHPVDLNEVLKLSCEMEKPLCAVAIPRAN